MKKESIKNWKFLKEMDYNVHYALLILFLFGIKVNNKVVLLVSAVHGTSLYLCDECSLYPQQRAGEGCRRGQAADAESQAPLSGPLAGRRPSNLAQLAEDDLWTLMLSVSWVRRTATNATTVETRRLVYCLFMQGLTINWFSHDFWRIIKEPEGKYEGTM